MTIPLANAVLTAINQGGTADDYDTPATGGAARWTGSVDIYVAEQILQAESPPSAGDLAPRDVDEVLTARLEIPAWVGAQIQRGDSLTFTYESATKVRTVRNIIRAPFVGRVRVTLEAA